MFFEQVVIRLKPRARGFHLVTSEIVAALPQLSRCRVGVAHIFIQHTSASLTINENVSPDVRGDLERHLNVMVPEEAPHYEHTLEGPDDMPAHVRTALTTVNLSIPVNGGRMVLGTWQGIYLWEHRHAPHSRRVALHCIGE